MHPTHPAITDLLSGWHAGDSGAFQQLVPIVYDSLRSAAARQVRRERPGHLRPTELVHELFLKLDGARRIDWENRGHFFAIATKLMRQVLVERARIRHAAKREGHRVQIALEDAPPIALSERDCTWLLDLDGALRELSEEDARKAEIVEMRYFGGMTCMEIGAELKISISTVEREMRMALAWLRLRMGSEIPEEWPA